MKAKQYTEKATVTIRQRKVNNGAYSLYLDIYEKGKRTKESLDLYLVPETSRKEKLMNLKTLQQAEDRRATREASLAEVNYDAPFRFKTETPFLEYFRGEMEKRKENNQASEYRNWCNAYSLLRRFCNEETTFNDITPEWCDDFKKYLDNVESYRHNLLPEDMCRKRLSIKTKENYLRKLALCLESAFKHDIIPNNPMDEVEKYKLLPAKKPEILTVDELRQLHNTPCLKPILKRMFLLSCFTGLRRTTIEALTWGDIEEDGDNMTITVNEGKQTYTVNVPEQGKAYLGKRGDDDELVFPDFHYATYMYVDLRQWALDAGIFKDFTFSTARYTYIAMLMSFGIEKKTIMEMIGVKEFPKALRTYPNNNQQ